MGRMESLPQVLTFVLLLACSGPSPFQQLPPGRPVGSFGRAVSGHCDLLFATSAPCFRQNGKKHIKETPIETSRA
jgi:hypothetical protein